MMAGANSKRSVYLSGVAFVAAVTLVGAACNGTAETNIGDPGGDADVSESDGGTVVDAADSGRGTERDVGVTLADSGGGDTGPSTADAGADMSAEPMRPVSAGCATGNGLADGEHTFTLDGYDRRFMLRLPAGYTRDKAWPVVFALHGNGGSVSYWDGTSGGRNIREVLKDDAILVVAEAIDGQWRDYGMPADTWPARIELELNYFEEILSMLRGDLCVADDNIFSMGFSGGGSFSGVLGCRRTDIRAIAVGGSVIYFDEANCVGTPAAWITIGTGELEPPRERYRDYFRDRASCDATSTATEPAPCVAYDNCGEGTPVHYCQHPDGHIWPDFGSQAMWDFFQQFVDSP